MTIRAFAISIALLFATTIYAVAISPQEVARHISQSATVEGVAYAHIKGSAIFLDMGGDFPNQSFQAVVFPDHASAFGDLNRYTGE